LAFWIAELIHKKYHINTHKSDKTYLPTTVRQNMHKNTILICIADSRVHTCTNQPTKYTTGNETSFSFHNHTFCSCSLPK